MTKPTSRRGFLKAAGAGAALAAVAGPAKGAAQQPAPKDSLTASTQALMDLVRARFGNHVTEEQMKQIRQSLLGLQVGANALKNVRLDNGDEPDFAFSAEEVN